MDVYTPTKIGMIDWDKAETKPKIINAIKLSDKTIIKTEDNRVLEGDAGQFLIKNINGRLEILSYNNFINKYKLIK